MYNNLTSEAPGDRQCDEPHPLAQKCERMASSTRVSGFQMFINRMKLSLEQRMRIAMDLRTVFSNFYLDGEAAFMSGTSLDQNPYAAADEAAAEWQAGWLSASYAATASLANRRNVQQHDAV